MRAQRLLPLILALAPATVFADVCGEVVSDTVAELRAGADGWWSEDSEALVRAAAGAACVKATSSRYNAAAEAPMSETPVETMAASEAAASSEPVQGSGEADATAVTESEQADPDDGEFSFGGLTFRSMSGAPSKKPYERTRSKGEN